MRRQYAFTLRGTSSIAPQNVFPLWSSWFLFFLFVSIFALRASQRAMLAGPQQLAIGGTG